MRTYLLGTMLLVLFVSPTLTAQEWKMKPEESSVTFLIKNAGLGVEGTFGELRASLTWDPAHLNTARLSGVVHTYTLDTGIGLRNKHLKGKDYFDAERFPELKFTSQSVRLQGEYYVASGVLTIKNVSRPIEIPFTFREQAGEGTFEGKFELNRLDYGVGRSSWTLADQVKVTILLKAQKVGSS